MSDKAPQIESLVPDISLPALAERFQGERAALRAARANVIDQGGRIRTSFRINPVLLAELLSGESPVERDHVRSQLGEYAAIAASYDQGIDELRKVLAVLYGQIAVEAGCSRSSRYGEDRTDAELASV